jgi:hypothetical protein
MKTLSFLRFGLCALNIAFVEAAGVERSVFGRRDSHDNKCDIRHALHILERLLETGESFCTSLLHTRKGETKTISDVVTSTEMCSVRTKTTTEHGTLTTL